MITPGLLEFNKTPKEMRRHLYTTNAIESFNSKLKREIRKRISLNTFDNADILITESCRSYNRKARTIRGHSEMSFSSRLLLRFKSNLS